MNKTTASNLIVTGATSGVGRAIVMNQLATGSRVVAVGRSLARLEQLGTLAQHNSLRDDLLCIEADLGDDGARSRLDKAARTFLGSQLDGVVHAAFGHVGEDEGVALLDVEPDRLRAFVSDSVTATLLTVKTFGSWLKASGGRLVLIIADWGLPQHNVLLTGETGDGVIGSEAFVAGKYALTGLASSLELQSGVITSAVYPGVVASWAGEDDGGEPRFLSLDSTEAEVEEAGYNVPDEAIPLADVAEAVEFVLARRASARTIVLKPRRTDYVGL